MNDMAAQTLLNNLDRCTKNFFMYRHPYTAEWYRWVGEQAGGRTHAAAHGKHVWARVRDAHIPAT